MAQRSSRSHLARTTDKGAVRCRRSQTDERFATEVLSPSTARYDRFAKRRLYQEVGVLLYWIVDPDERLVEVWTPGDLFPAVERERIVWHPSGAAQAVTLDLSQLFQPI
jgi:Uma2 family endonuclease